MFNLQRIAANTKIENILTREFLYGDDCNLFSHSNSDMLHLIDLFSNTCKALGQTICLDKTVVMYRTAPGKEYVEYSVYVDWQNLKIVDTFVYLCIT